MKKIKSTLKWIVSQVLTAALLYYGSLEPHEGVAMAPFFLAEQVREKLLEYTAPLLLMRLARVAIALYLLWFGEWWLLGLYLFGLMFYAMAVGVAIQSKKDYEDEIKKGLAAMGEAR